MVSHVGHVSMVILRLEEYYGTATLQIVWEASWNPETKLAVVLKRHENFGVPGVPGSYGLVPNHVTERLHVRRPMNCDYLWECAIEIVVVA